MYEIRLHVCERMINMVGGTFGITGQKQYRNVWDRFPDMINLQKIKRKAARKCFPLRLVHFFVA